jgi:ATP-dependent protease Clp ATPase subunit
VTDEGRCSFCDKPRADVRRLIACPRALICDGCVEVAEDFIDGTPPPLQPGECTFCEDSDARAQYRGQYAVICAVCIHTCAAILFEHAVDALPRARVVK